MLEYRGEVKIVEVRAVWRMPPPPAPPCAF